MNAILLSEFKGLMESDDKGHLLVGFDTPDGSELAVAMPNSMVSFVAMAMLASQKPKPGEAQTALDAAWFEVGQVTGDETGGLAISFELTEGARMTFRVTKDMASHLKDVLGVALGESPTPPPPGSLPN